MSLAYPTVGQVVDNRSSIQKDGVYLRRHDFSVSPKAGRHGRSSAPGLDGTTLALLPAFQYKVK